jgi:hypothetical protein
MRLWITEHDVFWRAHGYTPFSPVGDGTYQVTKAEAWRFVEAAGPMELFLDLEGHYANIRKANNGVDIFQQYHNPTYHAARMIRDAIGDRWADDNARPIFINGYNMDGDERLRIQPIFEQANMATVGGYIERPDTFERDVLSTIRHGARQRKINPKLRCCVQVMDSFADGTPLGDYADRMFQWYSGCGHFSDVLYWKPTGQSASSEFVWWFSKRMVDL